MSDRVLQFLIYLKVSLPHHMADKVYDALTALRREMNIVPTRGQIRAALLFSGRQAHCSSVHEASHWPCQKQSSDIFQDRSGRCQSLFLRSTQDQGLEQNVSTNG